MSEPILYIIRGADGLEYGPVTAEQVREWVAQHRADANSLIRPEGDPVGGRLGERPEFADLFVRTDPPPRLEAGAIAGGMGAGAGTSPGGTRGEGERMAEAILAQGYELRIGECFGRSWELLKGRFLLTAGACVLVMALYLGLGSFPVVGGVVALALTAVLFGGLDFLFLRLIRGQPAELGLVFAGFGPSFLALVLVGVISQVLTGVGLLLCLVPGIYLMVAWGMFAPLLVLDRRLGFWDALECSRRVVTRQWWACFGLLVLGLLVLLGGALLLLVGLVVALPWVTGAIVVAYEQLFGPEGAGAA